MVSFFHLGELGAGKLLDAVGKGGHLPIELLLFVWDGTGLDLWLGCLLGSWNSLTH